MQEKVNNARSEEKNNKNIKHSDNRNNKLTPSIIIIFIF